MEASTARVVIAKVVAFRQLICQFGVVGRCLFVTQVSS